MSRLLFVSLAALILCSCTNKVEDLKSPCVGAEGSPCERRPVNTDIPA